MQIRKGLNTDLARLECCDFSFTISHIAREPFIHCDLHIEAVAVPWIKTYELDIQTLENHCVNPDAIFLIAEITGGYSLFAPLAITATVAYLTIIIFEPHSLYTMRLAESGDLITHHKDKAVLTLLRLDSVIERDFTTVMPYDTLGQLVRSVSRSRRNLFPVVNDTGMFLGVVLLDDIRSVMFRSDQYDSSTVEEFMTLAPAKVSLDEPMESVLKKFEASGAWNLPVVEDGIYIGFVSKSKILSAYRELLVQFSDE